MKSRTLPHANQNLFKDLPMKLAPFVALTLACGTAAARDVGQIPANSDPKISTWFRTATSPSGTACCDEADGYREGVPLESRGANPRSSSDRGGSRLTATTSALLIHRTCVPCI
jgi:hypothetical protein